MVEANLGYTGKTRLQRGQKDKLKTAQEFRKFTYTAEERSGCREPVNATVQWLSCPWRTAGGGGGHNWSRRGRPFRTLSLVSTYVVSNPFSTMWIL